MRRGCRIAAPRSDYLQTEPGLAWTEKPFATRATATDGSRVTLRKGVLRVREGGGEFVDRQVDDAVEWAELLLQHFGLHDSASRAIQHRFIGFAVRDAALLRDVLRTSGDSTHRALAAASSPSVQR